MVYEAKIRVHGVVQGVLYRSWIQEHAVELGIKGYVRNEDRGTVLIYAQGHKEKLAKLVLFAKAGPSTSVVKKVEHDIRPIDKITLTGHFRIVD